MTAGPMDLRLRCPACFRAAGTWSAARKAAASCPCGNRISVRDGILQAIPSSRREYYARFLEDYSTIRRSEGRGSLDAAFYLALPFEDLTGRFSDQWKIRGRTYQYFEDRFLRGSARKRPLAILDLGAGNCWMSYRIARAGHAPVAVDLSSDNLDGLGAAVHYAGRIADTFPRIEAEFDALPLEDGQFDLAVFNASFHYSTDYPGTLREIRRCLEPEGRVVILDSPIYRRREFGEKMLRERRENFEKRFGTRSDSLPSREYLYDSLLRELERDLGLRWEIHTPWYGWKWALRPWKARLAGERPPSEFRILVGTWDPK